jgi:hypothetical protein
MKIETAIRTYQRWICAFRSILAISTPLRLKDGLAGVAERRNSIAERRGGRDTATGRARAPDGFILFGFLAARQRAATSGAAPGRSER